MFVTTRSKMMFVVSLTGPRFSDRPTKKATRFGVGADKPTKQLFPLDFKKDVHLKPDLEFWTTMTPTDSDVLDLF